MNGRGKESAPNAKRAALKKKMDARQLGEAALHKAIEEKDWTMVRNPVHRKAIKAVVFEIGRLEFPAIHPDVSTVRVRDKQYRVSVGGWNKEVTADMLGRKLVDNEDGGMSCVTGATFNPATAVVTVAIDLMFLKMVKTRHGQKRSHRLNVGQASSNYKAMGGRRRGAKVNLKAVDEHDRATVDGVLAAIDAFTQDAANQTTPSVIAPRGQPAYKIMITGMQKEIDVAATIAMFRGRNRDPRLALVTTVGFDPRGLAFVVRLAKPERVHTRREVQQEAMWAGRAQQRKKRTIVYTK